MSGRAVPSLADIRSRYDAAAAGYDQRFRAHRKRLRFRIIDGPQLALAARARGRVLELGCGTGRLLGQLPRPGVGVDLSMESLRVARGRGLAGVAGDAHRLPFRDGSFDVVMAGNASFRYLDYDRAFAECARVLRPGGWLGVHQYSKYCFSPRDWLRPPPPPIEMHVGDIGELERPAVAAGFSLRATHLYRSVRVFPYALPIPRRLPGHLWAHCTLVFQRVGSK